MEVIQCPGALGQVCHFGLSVLITEYSAAAKVPVAELLVQGTCSVCSEGLVLFSCLQNQQCFQEAKAMLWVLVVKADPQRQHKWKLWLVFSFNIFNPLQEYRIAFQTFCLPQPARSCCGGAAVLCQHHSRVRGHTASLCMVLRWENCRNSYNSLTEIRRMLREFCYFHVSRGDMQEESISLATILEP